MQLKCRKFPPQSSSGEAGDRATAFAVQTRPAADWLLL
jgi:hypothetical protein